MASHWTGLEEVSAALALMATRTSDATGEGIKKILEQVQRQQQVLLSLGYHAPGTPTGSRSPEPPWRISGHLRDTVRVERPQPHGHVVWTGRVGPTAVYGRIQELGGRTGRGHRTVLPPRPSLRPAWQIVRPTAAHTMYDAWHAATRPR